MTMKMEICFVFDEGQRITATLYQSGMTFTCGHCHKVSITIMKSMDFDEASKLMLDYELHVAECAHGDR